MCISVLVEDESESQQVRVVKGVGERKGKGKVCTSDGWIVVMKPNNLSPHPPILDVLTHM